MGGREGGGVSIVIGQGKRIKLGKKIENAAPEIVANAAAEAVLTSTPALSSLYLAYRVVQFMYPIVKEGVKEYDKTGDVNKAVEAGAKEAIKQTANIVVEKSVEGVYEKIKTQTGIKTDHVMDTIITSIVSDTINEVRE